MWLNSSVRGPFLPAYHPRDVHWTRAFVRKLTRDVKLVGATINCGGAYALSAQQPHVQSYAVAMDQVLFRWPFKFAPWFLLASDPFCTFRRYLGFRRASPLRQPLTFCQQSQKTRSRCHSRANLQSLPQMAAALAACTRSGAAACGSETKRRPQSWSSPVLNPKP